MGKRGITNARYWKVIVENKTVSWEVISKETGMGVSGIFMAMRNNRTLDFEKTWIIARMLGLRMDDLSDYTEHISTVPSIEHPYEKGDSFSERFWNTVNAIRESMNLSWAEVGKEAQLPASTISSAKTQGRILSFEQVSAIVNAGLHCSMNDLINIMFDEEIKVEEEQKQISEMAVRIMQLSSEDRSMINALVSRLLDK